MPEQILRGQLLGAGSSEGVAFELETLDAEPWRRLGISDAVAGRAAVHAALLMLRYATALAPLPAELRSAVAARSFTELIRAAATAGVAVQRLRPHTERRRELRPRPVRRAVDRHAGGIRGRAGYPVQLRRQPTGGSGGGRSRAKDDDLVLSRTAPPHQVSAALGVRDLNEVPAVIAARPVIESLQRLTAAGIDTVRACPDLAELAVDRWAAILLRHDRCTLVRPPWTFTTR